MRKMPKITLLKKEIKWPKSISPQIEHTFKVGRTIYILKEVCLDGEVINGGLYHGLVEVQNLNQPFAKLLKEKTL
jgi:hypothetical protein